jgi:hypothetical protein
VSIDDEVRRIAMDAVAQHAEGAPHLTEDRVREIVAEMLDTRPPTGPPVFDRLPDDRVIFQLDPDRPDTFKLNRPFGQIWSDSKVYNPRNPLDIVHDHLPPEHRIGYGLQMEPDGTVRFWPMEDGTEIRNGIVEHGGRRWYRIAHQFRLEDGYHADANRRFSQGHEVSRGGWRINTAINRLPGHSSPVTYDGTRGGIHGHGALLNVGIDAEPLVWGIEFDSHRSHRSASNRAGPFDLHEPGTKLTGPFLTSIESGELTFWSKTSPHAAAVNYATVTQSDLHNVVLYRMPLPTSGTTKIVCRTVVDGTGANSLFEVYEVGPGGEPVLLHSTTDRYGYTFTDPELNGQFYPIVQLYQWHEHNRPGSGREPLWNHDPTFGNVNRLDVACFAVSASCTPREMAHHVASFNPQAYALAV